MSTPGPPRLRRDYLTSPSTRRLPLEHPARSEILDRHDQAVERHMPSYRDPTSGLTVFTAAFLARRGYCCESGCRHCPYTT